MWSQQRGDDPWDRQHVTDALARASRGPGTRQVPAALCQATLRLLPVTGVSVSLGAGNSVRALWCASDETAARIAEAQYTLGDGPCRAALELAAPVLAADLTGGPDARRWPVFSQAAVELGVRAVFSLPLGTSGQAIGTLDLYRDAVGALSERELRIALLVRDAVTYAVLNQLPGAEDNGRSANGGVASWVEAAAADHAEVHQAVGMIMVQLGIDPRQALDRMRARAFAQGRTVTEVARDVLTRSVRFHPDEDTRRRGTDEEGR
ncbi:GAF and ANTAR domain-containing protein [Streptomyces sp. NBC_01451]|uniref:GAF and ANTAR domain-containing protein n=1 Tax=Streptomyces sp. NBC_01451 TaxID=2903872 RepID=UPI002E2ED375|nr:GAF and ANTAR domain-containing protein [Streptomyces sp. NBC_01451]